MAKITGTGKIMETALPKSKSQKGDAGYVEGRKSNAKLPAKSPAKEKYKK